MNGGRNLVRGGRQRRLVRPDPPGLLAPLILYLGAALLATWPLLFHLGSVLIGDPRSDAWKHAWGFWWFRESFEASGNPFPLRTSWLGFPQGGSLYNIDPINSLLSVPLQSVLPLPLCFNGLVLANLVAGALAAWLLARRLTGDSWTALPGGVIYAFCPYVLCYTLASGVTETVSLLWTPLFLLLLLDVPDRGWLHGAATGAVLGMTAISCWYYGLFALIWGLVWMAWGLTRALRRDPHPDPRDDHRPRLMRRALLCLVVLIVFVDVTCPVFMAFSMTLKNPDSLHPGYTSVRRESSLDEYLSARFNNAAHLVDFFATGKSSAVVTSETDRLVRSAYVGAVVLLLALVGLRASRHPTRGFWLASALLFAVLAMGPRFYVAADSVHSLPNPIYDAFYVFFPAFTQIAIPFRFCVPLMLALGLLACLGLDALLARAQPGRRRMASVGVSVLILGEFLVISPAPAPMPLACARMPAVYRVLRDDPSVRGVLDLPVDWIDGGKLLPGVYFYSQSVHRKPIPYRVSGIISGPVADNVLVSYVRALVDGLPLESRPSPMLLDDSARALAEMGFDRVILHLDLLSPGQRPRIRRLLDGTLGPPVARGADLILYRLPGGAP